ncbi:TerB family tellurite resistance protein, partial [Phocaeicola barnesiae]|uniref:TerB family tellurite resistance protein n=1 Tax=Phocaeicola barnesiae TaxID=376804 RepID=UPI00241FDD45
AVAVIKADGVVEESEKQILSDYANEMQIPVCNLDEQCDADNIIKEFAMTSTPQTKRIIFLELLALAFADGNYAAEEKALVQQLADAFEFDRAFIEQAINLEDAYVAAYMSLVNLVEKGE